MDIHGNGVKPGSLHRLTGRDGVKQVFQWTGKSWSTPGTRYGTKPSAMMVLGWSYAGPQEQEP